MTHFASYVTDLMDSARKRRAYRRTLDELRHLPESIARDVNIAPHDAERVARQAVYGA